MDILKFRVRGQALTLINPNVNLIPVTDTVNQYLCQFEFNEDWDDLNKVVVFKNVSYNITKEVYLSTSNECYIPWEVLSNSGDIFLEVIGTESRGEVVTVRIPSTLLGFKWQIQEGLLDVSANISPTPDLFEQFVSSVRSDSIVAATARDEAVIARDVAVQSAADASASELAATSAVESAENSASMASSAASSASEAALSVAGIADETRSYAEIASTKAAEAATEAELAAGAKEDAVMAKNDADMAKNDAEAARDAAVVAKNDAETARDATLSAKETFDNNAETKLTAYNQNALEKTASYNTNATEKLNAYNANADNRVAEFDAHTEQIQTDISELKSDFNSVIYKSFSKNLYDESKVVSGYLNSDGTIHADNGSGWQTTDFIDCVENKTFTCSFEFHTSKRESCSAFFLTEYDSNKNVIKQTNTAISPFTVSSDAYFFRLCNQTSYKNKYQIEIGSSYTDYVPYSYRIYVDKIKNGIVGYKKLDESLTELFTPSKFINQELDYSIGGYVDKRGIVSAFDNCYVTDFIDCTDINAIKYYGKSYYDGVCLLIFDDSKNVMSYYPANTSGINLFDDVVIIPKNAKYVRIADYSGATATNVMVGFSKSIELSTNKKWNDKKWVCIGDSLTEVNSRTTKHYHDYISEETGISVVNMGVSGSGYAKGSDTSQAFYQRATNTPTDADVITIFGSFNDMSSELEVGTYLDGDTTTLAGCINATIDAIQSRVPLANIGIVSPTPWVSTQPNETGRAYEYVAVMKRICEHRSIPFLDLWRCSNLRPWDADFRPIAYSKDDGNGVHPDETGHKIIAPRFKAFLETLIM